MRFYDGKKVFITGGSSGIGKAAAVMLAEAGASVMVAARNQERLDATVDEMRAAGGTGQIFGSISLDVRDRDAVRAAAQEAIDTLGGVDVLIVNQGYALTGYIQDMPDEAFDEMLDTNYRGHVYVTRAFLPHFMEKKSGHICLVSSMLGFFGFFGYSAYAASKHAIAGFARCLRNELVPHGVKVTLVYPPTTDTPGLEKENEDKPPETWAIEGNSECFAPEAVAESMLKGIAKGKFEVVPGFSSWAIWVAHRFAPTVTEWFIDQDLLRFTKKQTK